MANVYFTNKFDIDSVKTIFLKAYNEIGPFKDKAAVKVHFGEKGNTMFVHPKYVKAIVEAMGTKNYFITDTNTLYKGSRLKSSDHKKLAIEHGFFGFGEVIISDKEKQVEINKNIFKNVKIAKQIAEADALVVISHFKGHMLFSFGGAIKNLGMGCGSRAGKLEMHSKIRPNINEKCIACGECVEHCPADAIKLSPTAVITDACIGCAECIAVCQQGAVNIPWRGATSIEAQERCAEYAYGTVKEKKAVFVTFLNNITKDCDCLKDSKIIGRDVGVIASTDPVAIDQAGYDLIVKSQGDIFQKATGADGTHILEYSEKMGLGKRSYVLIQ